MSRRAALVGGALGILAVGIETAWAPEQAPLLVAIVGFVLAAGVVAERHLLLAVGLALGMSLALPSLVLHAVTTTPFRVRVADLIALPLLVAAAIRILVRGRFPRLGLHMVVILVAGVAWTAWGIHRGHPVDEAGGTFRRLCLYPTVFIATALSLDEGRIPVKALSRLVLAAAGVVTAVAVVHMALGQGYHAAYYARGPGPQRFISPFDAFAPILAFNLLLGQVLTERRGRAWRLAVMLVLMAVVVVSNYRSVWVAFGLSVLTYTVVTRQRPQRYLWVVGVLGGIAAVALILVFHFAPAGSLPTAKLSATNVHRGVDWRLAAWRNAGEVFLHHPLAGVGFGYRQVFQYRNGPHLSHVVTVVGKTIHNDLLWLLVNFGLFGALLVIGFHARWWHRSATFAGDEEGRSPRGRLVAAILATHLAILAVAMMEPILDHPAAAIDLYVLMALAQAAVPELVPVPAAVVPLEAATPGSA